MEDWTALLPTIVRESDLRDLADFTRRWQRLPVVLAAGVAIAAVMLLARALFTPVALRELPAGSIVLLAWLLYDFGRTSIYWGNLFYWAFMAREARYDHHLFWPSPADSPEIQKAMRRTTQQGFVTGWWITFLLVLTVVLVGWDSPLVLPLAVGFVVIGYLTTIGAAFQQPCQRPQDRREEPPTAPGLVPVPHRHVRTTHGRPVTRGVRATPGSPLPSRRDPGRPHHTHSRPHLHAHGRGADRPHHRVRHHRVRRSIGRTHPRRHPPLSQKAGLLLPGSADVDGWPGATPGSGSGRSSYRTADKGR